MMMKNLETRIQNILLSTNENLYDLSMLTDMDDNDYLVEILMIFLRETPVELKEMKDALNACKYENICQKAHKLKGSAGILQAVKLIELLEEIEIVSKLGSFNNELIHLVEDAQHQYYRIEQSLKKHVQALG